MRGGCLVCRGVLGVELGDGGEYFGGEVVELADGVILRGDGFADCKQEWARADVVTVDRHGCVGADEGHGDDGDLGPDGHVGHAAEEGVKLAVEGAAAFGEDDEWESVLEGLDAGVQAAQAGVGVAEGNGDLSAAAQVPAEEGNFKEAAFGEDAKLKTQAGEERRRVEI